jgi:hypothetical protein
MPTPPLSHELALEVVEAVKEHGSQAAAARALGIAEGTFKNRYKVAVLRGLTGTKPVLDGFEIRRTSAELDDAGNVRRQWVQQKPEAGEEFAVPEGHRVKGVSALVGGDGRVISQWIKTGDERDPVADVAAIKAALEGLQPAKPVSAPEHYDVDLITVYPLADMHFGLMSYGRETGQDYDTNKASDRLRKWIGMTVDASPSSGTAVILDVGDTTHADDQTNQTPTSKHQLDVDTRHFRTIEIAVSSLAYAVEYALRRHARVIVRILPGNHSKTSYIAIMFALAERYRNEPRVEVQKVPGEFWVHQFGKCFLAAHHGDKAKPERIVMFLADEYAAAWGKTRHRFLWTGHLHSHKSADIGGVVHEQLRAMTARDAYAVANAYVGRSQLQGITLHRLHGEVLRVKVGC